MIRILLIILFINSVSYGATVYKEVPSEVWVEDVHYDESLQDIVIHVHAHFLFIHIDRIYGIKVRKVNGVKEKVNEIVGGSPLIFELR